MCFVVVPVTGSAPLAQLGRGQRKEGEMRIVYDTKLKQPGCVLIQSAAGCTVPRFHELFPSERWLTFPTPDMKIYDVTDEQLEKMAKISI
jgi:hypothetical protein